MKLFADGAIISQLMQMREPYLDADGNPDPEHHGEWLMEPDVFAERALAYWHAGYQLHVHVNGDAGLDLVLDTLERCLAEAPRDDHRTVVVHFANSTPEQVDRIAELGAIVSSNPYYPVGFADKYAEWGLGPERADVMTRNRSVVDRGVPLSFHSDLPMGRSDPIGMMHCAVNRITQSGRVAGPEERIDAEAALRASRSRRRIRGVANTNSARSNRASSPPSRCSTPTRWRSTRSRSTRSTCWASCSRGDGCRCRTG